MLYVLGCALIPGLYATTCSSDPDHLGEDRHSQGQAVHGIGAVSRPVRGVRLWRASSLVRGQRCVFRCRTSLHPDRLPMCSNLVGVIYPVFASFKAVKSVSTADDSQWLMYWVVFGCFSVVESFGDKILFWYEACICHCVCASLRDYSRYMLFIYGVGMQAAVLLFLQVHLPGVVHAPHDASMCCTHADAIVAEYSVLTGVAM